MKIVRTILMIINLVAALVLLLTTVAGIVPPDRSLLPSLMAFAYLPMLAVNLVLAVVWLLMRRWECLISLVVIGLRWSTLFCHVQAWGTPTPPSRNDHPQMVSVLTHNVHQFHGAGTTASPSDSCATEFLKMVRRADADLLCLQEFAAASKMNITDSLTLMGYNHYYGAHTARNGSPYGTVVFARMPITYVKRIDSDKLMVEIMHPIGARFRVCCLHMASYHFDQDDREEIEHLRHGGMDKLSQRTIAKIKSTITAHQSEWENRVAPVVNESSLPMLVVGDMNDIPTSWLYSQMTEHLTDAFREQGFGLSPTYNGGFPQFRIDMALHSEGWRTLSYRRLRDHMSDHYPVLTSFELEI